MRFLFFSANALDIGVTANVVTCKGRPLVMWNCSGYQT